MQPVLFPLLDALGGLASRVLAMVVAAALSWGSVHAYAQASTEGSRSIQRGAAADKKPSVTKPGSSAKRASPAPRKVASSRQARPTKAAAKSPQSVRPTKLAKAPTQARRPVNSKATAKARPNERAQPVRRAAAPSARQPASQRSVVISRAPVQRLSYGQMAGLHRTQDPLDLNSSVALVVDHDTGEVLFSKNPQAVLPIASITKLMTALVVLESNLPLDEMLTISQDDVDTEKGSRSRLHVGARLSRGQMLHLALMASENRAAHALGRHHPGGLSVFVRAMNAKADALGMEKTRFVEPTGLSSANQSSASDLTVLVKAASVHDRIRELSTAPDTQVSLGQRQLEFRNTNSLIRQPHWDIGLQKTGYISEAGRCVVMQAQMAGRHVIMVLLDAAGRQSRVGDAERLRRWLGQQLSPPFQPS